MEFRRVGRFVLNRNLGNYFAEVEQAAFNPAHFVPGIGPSPDKMLQGRLFYFGEISNTPASKSVLITVQPSDLRH